MSTVISASTTLNTAYNVVPDTSGSLAFATGASPTTAMTISSSQNVGIGTSSPATKLDVQVSGGRLQVYPAASTTGVRLLAVNTSNAAAVPIEVSGTDVRFTNSSNTVVGMFDTSGNLLVGTTSTAAGQSGHTVVLNSTATALNTFHGNGVATGNAYHAFYYNAGYIGGITQNGTTAVAYNTTSDYRLKENVQPLSGALSRVAALKPCTYTWKSAPDEIGEGFIAHEVAEVCPQAVTGKKDAVDEEGNAKYQSIDTSFLIATLTAAIQEQQALITQLQADVAALKGQA